jgi:hypothetical protein
VILPPLVFPVLSFRTNYVQLFLELIFEQMSPRPCQYEYDLCVTLGGRPKTLSIMTFSIATLSITTNNLMSF